MYTENGIEVLLCISLYSELPNEHNQGVFLALSSFRKHCSNVLSTALRFFVCDKNGNFAHNHRFFIILL